jgi:hypothetical protein
MHANVSILHKTLHLIPVMPVYLIIFTVTYAFTQHYAFDNSTSTFKYLTIPIFYYNAVMVIICHSLSMWTNPGEVTVHPLNSELENFPPQVPPHHPLYCKKCNGTRPERSHHCKVCRKCVMKMDHHCPWIANCVGLWNIKYFYLFLFYATLGDLIASVCLYLKFREIDFSQKLKDQKVSTILELLNIFKEPLILIIAIIFAVAMTVSIGFLFVLQTRNLINDTTTLESLFELKKKSGDNHKERLENFKTIMGDKIYIWFIPINHKNDFKSGEVKFNSKDGNKHLNSNMNSYISLTDNIQEFDDNIHISLNLSD